MQINLNKHCERTLAPKRTKLLKNKKTKNKKAKKEETSYSLNKEKEETVTCKDDFASLDPSPP